MPICYWGNSMIDIHCHILPGMDDGPRSLAESLAMAKEAARQGITKIIATPHHDNGSFTNPANNIIGAADYLHAKVQNENIPVDILPGQVTRLHGDILRDIKAGIILPLNEMSRYVLIELPDNHIPEYTSQLLFDMQIAGYKPIIAHPERHEEFHDNPDKLYRLVKSGVITQAATASVIVNAGKKVQKFTLKLLEANLIHCITSNAHHSKRHAIY